MTERGIHTLRRAAGLCRTAVLIGLYLLPLWNGGFSHAEKLFKYRDENGIWHFTNIPPDTPQPVEVRQVRVEKGKERLTIQKRGTKERPVFWAVNGYYGPVELEISLEKQANISTEPQMPIRTVIPAYGETLLAALRPSDPARPWRYRSRYRYIFGNPNAEHRPPAPYELPFQSGKSFAVSQGFHGKYSHHYPTSEFAVDFPMPEGTRIRAARDGVVMDIASDFFTGGVGADYGERANLIRILHDDGTMALYAHLKLESARFPLGRRVKAGDVIAESGNTGFSTGPHLHFVIQINQGMRLVSVPFVFKDLSGKGVTPKETMMFTAPR